MFNRIKVSKYRVRLFFNFFFLFVAFSIAIGIFQFRREKSYRVGQLESTLIMYNKLINEAILHDSLHIDNTYFRLKSITDIVPDKEIRITVIAEDGTVLYDSSAPFMEMENHLSRPEIQTAKLNITGKSIRHSATTNKVYYYLAIKYDNYYVRTALPYTINTVTLLKADTLFIYVIGMFFIVSIVVLLYFSDRFAKSISKLHQFANNAASDKEIVVHEEFPNNELGAIGGKIVEVYNSLQKARLDLNAEKEKLYRHLQNSREGIAIFPKDKKQLLANNNFVQYLNMLSDETAITPNKVFQIKALKPIIKFIEDSIESKLKIEKNDQSSNVLTVRKGGKYFLVQAIVFNDLSFEISINDVTKVEKEKKLKQQMTSNIAHELKTPVSSILGYLETIITSNVDKEKSAFFIERSFIQAQRLSSLIQDISLLNKIEEASDMFTLEEINVKETINLIIEDLRQKIDINESSIIVEIDKFLTINGNKPIFYSIWRNLTENALNYAGKGTTIRIKNYLVDDNYVYFSFSDNGVGIEEKHLSRIFERFYRVDSGRSRSMGGTGLGLAIVKNGIHFHRGEISVKNLKNGGIEFIFNISRHLENEQIATGKLTSH